MGKLHGGYDVDFFKRSVESAIEANWVVTMHIDTDHLINLADVIAKIDAPTVIDNCAMIDARLGLDQPALRTLFDLLKAPNVWIKTAAAYRMLKKGATYEQMVPVAKALHHAAPDRTIWGTNWPVPDYFKPGEMPNDGDLVDMLRPNLVPGARHSQETDGRQSQAVVRFRLGCLGRTARDGHEATRCLELR